MDSKVKYAFDTLADEYGMEHDTPWCIGYSGGKDSTAVVELVWEMLVRRRAQGLPLHRKVIIISNDTAVENPVILGMLDRSLEGMRTAALEAGLPIQVIKTKPPMTERFWVKVIGHGYPIPNQSFRWCTDRLKIRPSSKAIKQVVGDYGRAILLLGTRSDESKKRGESIRKHARRGKRLSKHPTHFGVEVFSPISDLSAEHVWGIIATFPCPWGTAEELYRAYADASADDYECPTVVSSKSHKSCGQSRFGCWTCSVVKEDKSMTTLVENGRDELRPLLDFRNALVLERTDPAYREPIRRDGKTASVNGMGCYTMEYRKSILRRLLIAQKESGISLIESQELTAIGLIWMRHYGDFSGVGRFIEESNLLYGK